MSIRESGMNLDTVLFRTTSDFEMSMMKPEELVRAYRDSKRAYGDLRLVFERLTKARAKMYERGVTYRYNGAGNPESLAFIVIDEKKAKGELRKP